ncbi:MULTISPECIES: PEP-CTERM sorting domain-containing protein [Marinobacter]|uniref:PEP-CTERM protein-sorting domain-containing protein n=1 Tax=Marinobacter mobilis TaxID=488533 RepID=A0A1H2UU36_9GAMM|nr:PEP-CTERM protein-sorting domain-containing protein [Marinobacter mobilis]
MFKGKLSGRTLGVALSVMGAVSVAEAAPILNISEEGSAATEAAEAQFLSYLQGDSIIKEGFEGFADGLQQNSLVTAVGVFTQTVAGGDPVNSLCAPNCADGVAVLSDVTSPFNGRFAAPDEAGNNQWLDSFDSEVMTLTVADGVNAIGFYITDPNDIDGRMSVGGVDFSFADIFGQFNGDGEVYYISLYDEAGLGDIVFYANSNNDGFGIDSVTIGKVPEPGTLALMGLGLAGLGLTRRRKRA